jgi:formylglycine-generating enzyme required for sulfatase activity
MKNFTKIKSIFLLICLFSACKEKNNQQPAMISLPQFEYVAQITKNYSTQNVNISLDAFYISNEITNKEYREFTDWVKENPDEILTKPKEIIIKKNPEPGKTKVWTVPYWINMFDLLPSLIDSNAMYKVDKKYKNYFTDEKYNDFPVVGVSRNAAEYYCVWLIGLERETIVLHKGQTGPDGMKVKEKISMMSSPGYGYYRIPLEMEWEYASRQPYKRKYNDDHQLHKVTEGNVNRWGIFHIHDNVSEWVSSPDDTLSISRGNNWRTVDNSSERLRMHPDSSSGLIGFRIARTYKPEVINSEEKK